MDSYLNLLNKYYQGEVFLLEMLYVIRVYIFMLRIRGGYICT